MGFQQAAAVCFDCFIGDLTIAIGRKRALSEVFSEQRNVEAVDIEILFLQSKLVRKCGRCKGKQPKIYKKILASSFAITADERSQLKISVRLIKKVKRYQKERALFFERRLICIKG